MRSIIPWRPSRFTSRPTPASRISSRMSVVSTSGGDEAYSRSSTRGEPPHAQAELRPLLGVRRAVVADRLRRLAHVVPELERAAVGEHAQDPRIGMRDREPVLRELQLLDERRRHPADVGGRVRARLLLEHEHLAAALGERVRGDEAVGPRADDDRVRGSCAVLQHLQRREPARRAHDAAARMRAGAALLVAPGSACGTSPTRGAGPQEEELLQRELALEDVALGEPGDPLDVQRREHLPVQDAAT